MKVQVECLPLAEAMGIVAALMLNRIPLETVHYEGAPATKPLVTIHVDDVHREVAVRVIASTRLFLNGEKS